MFIQTEATPNPATLKFIPGKVVMADRHLRYAATRHSASALRRLERAHV
jgi:cytochrome oxidase assembly protein ShyY1